MKLILIKNNLKESLSIAERAVSENQNLPILKNVFLVAEENMIKLNTTNLEIAIRAAVAGKIIEGGRVCIPLHTLSGVVGNLSNERLSFETKDQRLEIKTDNYHATLQGAPPNDFPLIPKITNTNNYIEIHGEIFKEALNQVIAATQFSDLRPEFNSILFNFSLEAITFAATDSFRLAEKTLNGNQFSTNHKEGFKLLVPLKTSQELLRIIKDDETVRIFHDAHQILFITPSIELISRLVVGNFPDYRAVIPQKFAAEVVLERQELLNALKLASVFGSRTSEVKIKISENKKALEVSSVDQAIGENQYLLPAKIKGFAKENNFNWRYLSDGLKVLKANEVFFGLNEENKPAILKLTQEASYFYIVMPILKA